MYHGSNNSVIQLDISFHVGKLDFFVNIRFNIATGEHNTKMRNRDLGVRSLR